MKIKIIRNWGLNYDFKKKKLIYTCDNDFQVENLEQIKFKILSSGSAKEKLI